jgi:hypothetical protein
LTRKLALACAVGGLASVAALAGTGQAGTQSGQPWVVNGSVNALAVSGHTLYLGGNFTRVSPRTGPLVAFSASGGRRGFPVAEGGEVDAIAGDGEGGWFVGGDFTRMGGVYCPNLARVTPGRTVDRRFCPRPDDAVLSLAVDGPTLYVGGAFRRIAGTKRSNLAAVAAATGRVAGWKPAVDDAVSGLAVRKGVLYLLGDFGTVGGKERFALAAVDEQTGKVTGWAPKAPEDDHGDPAVTVIAAGPSAIYVGGLFDAFDGNRRSSLAALDPSTGKPTSWAPKSPWAVESLAVVGSRLYVGGTLDPNGDGKSALQAYDLATGKRAGWAPTVGPDGVTAIGVSGDRVYASDSWLEAFDATSGKRVAWHPALPNGPVEAIAPASHLVAVGGRFNGAGGLVRDSLAALDLRTGHPTAWSPQVLSSGSGPEVDAIVRSGRIVYVAGDFEHLGGRARHLLGAVDATTGKAASWAPAVQGDQMLALALAGSNVYAGGFQTGSQFDSPGGGLGWNSPPETGDSASVNAIVLGHGAAYFGGSFEVIGGKSRLALAALDPQDGAATAWSPHLMDTGGAEPMVQALALSGSTLLVGGSFASAGGAKRADLASFDLGTGKVTTWAPKTDLLSVYSLAVTPRLVYVGGDGGIVAVNAKTGTQLAWHPQLTQGSIGFTLMQAIAVVGSTVYVGGDGGLDVFPAPRA